MKTTVENTPELHDALFHAICLLDHANPQTDTDHRNVAPARELATRQSEPAYRQGGHGRRMIETAKAKNGGKLGGEGDVDPVQISPSVKRKIDHMVIWKDISVLYRAKELHIKKIGGKLYHAFCLSFGEVPVGNFNEITGKFEACENARGRAYGARKRLRYRRKKGAL